MILDLRCGKYIKCSQSGFTLIEVITVMAIFIILASLGLFLSMDFYKSFAFHNERKILVSILQKARSQSLANINQKPHGMYIDYAANPKTYTLFQGSNYASRDVNQDIVFQASWAVTPLGMTEVVFSQLSGQASVSGGNLTLRDSIHSDAVIFINNEGRIDF